MANDPRFEVYPRHHFEIEPGEQGITQKKRGDYGWRFRAANGQITAVGGEGFTRREDAHRAVADFVKAIDISAAIGEPLPTLDVED